MNVPRCEVFIATNLPKESGKRLSREEIFNIGYMAGRYGINLDGNLDQNIKPVHTREGVLININQCTQDLLKDNLHKLGVRFETII